VSLFRAQAVEHKKQHLYGSVMLIPKLSHTLIIGGLLVWVTLVMIWLCTSRYARKETVLGWLEPPTGIVRLYAQNNGTIQKIFITEGSYVEQDQPIVMVETEALLSSGKQLSIQLLDEYEAQQKLLEEQIARTHISSVSRMQDIAKKIDAAQQESAMLTQQLDTIEKRFTLITQQAERLKSLRLNGHVSNSDVDYALGQELTLRSDKQALQRNQIAQQNLIEQLKTQKKLLPNDSANETAQLQTKLSELTQQITQVKGQSTRIIKAPRAGFVNNLQAREGQQISTLSNVPLLTLIPRDKQLTAHLLIPVRSAGFIDAGQRLNIRYDAFPYQKFGLYDGEILQVSKTLLLPNELLNAPIAIQEPVYRVTARLAQPDVQAYGKTFPLKPGMTLSADIRLSDRTLLQWLLEPLYSLKGRL
jgi:membrane fusion protein